MKHVIPCAAALLLVPAAFAQTTTPTPTTAPGQTATPTPTDQASPDAQSMSTATDSSVTGLAVTAAVVKPTVDATVYGSAGTAVGKIKAIDGKLVTLTTPKGDIRLETGSIGPGPQGPSISVTAEQLSTMIDQAKVSQPVATSKTTSAATTGAGTTTTKTSTRTHKRSRK